MLKDIIDRVGYLDVYKALKKFYPDLDHDTILAHLKVMMDVREFVPKQTDITIHCEWVGPDEFDDVGYWNVYGTSETDDPGMGLALDFTAWDEWMGMECVIPPALEECEFVAHCLWEMTFMGFTQEEVMKHKSEIEDELEKVLMGLEGVVLDHDEFFRSLCT